MFIRWIPNSPRWLLARGYIEETSDILIESAIYNKRQHLLPPNLDQLLEQQVYDIQKEPAPAAWWTLFQGPKAIRHMICVHICWSIYIITYYGMLLNIRAFSREHLEINTMIAGMNFNHFYLEKTRKMAKKLVFTKSSPFRCM